MKDPEEDFMEYDFSMGSSAVNCPHCGAVVSCNFMFDDVLECPHCGSKFETED